MGINLSFDLVLVISATCAVGVVQNATPWLWPRQLMSCLRRCSRSWLLIPSDQDGCQCLEAGKGLVVSKSALTLWCMNLKLKDIMYFIACRVCDFKNFDNFKDLIRFIYKVGILFRVVNCTSSRFGNNNADTSFIGLASIVFNRSTQYQWKPVFQQ